MGQFGSFAFEFPSGDSKIQFAAVSLRQNELTWTEGLREPVASAGHPRPLAGDSALRLKLLYVSQSLDM